MLLASCSKKAQPGTSAQTGQPVQKETIVLGGWPAGDTAFEAIIGLFNQEYPNIEVKIGNFMPSGDYHRELQASITAGSGAPDVAMIEEAWVGRYKDDAGFENLLAAPYNAGDIKKDFVEYRWNMAMSVDGKQMIGLVWDIGPACFFYNRAVFASAGLPTEPADVEKYMSTWDGVLDVAKKVSIPGARWFVPNAADVFGWNFLNRDFYDAKLNFVIERPGVRDALNAAMTIRKNGWDANVGLWDNETYGYMGGDQLAGVAAGCWYGGFLKSWIAADSAGKWGICRLPVKLADSNQGGSFLAIPSQSKNKDAAWKFIKFALATRKAQNTMFEKVDYFPGYKPAWDDPLYNQEDPYFAGQKTRALWADIANSIKPTSYTLMDSTTDWELIQAANDGMNANMNADQIIQSIKDRVEEVTKLEKEQYINILSKAGKW
jgi:multiple sugar transport system substrate-binding protein